MAGHVASMDAVRSVYGIVIGKAEGKRRRRGPGHRWEDIKMDFKEMGYMDMHFIHVAEGGN